MFGWILNVQDPSHDQLVERDQLPCFYVKEPRHGTDIPVFEVWFWHREVKRWFCMATKQDPLMVQHGVVYFWPGDIEGLKRRIKLIGGVPRNPLLPKTG